jgi:hypothetical protein
MAPEVGLDVLPVSGDKIDVYSFGVFLSRIFVDGDTLETGHVQNAQQRCLALQIASRFRRVRPETIPDAFCTLIAECWHRRPDRRPSFAEITRRMMDSDAFTIAGTDMKEYHEYRDRLMRESSNVPQIDWSPIEAQLRSLGIPLDSLTGLHP